MKRLELENILTTNGIKITPNRILVLEALINSDHPVNLADMEVLLAPMDRASIFRVLELFADKEIVHVIEDGSRSIKYEVCKGEGHHHASDQHAHFYCEKCGATICLDDVHIPEMTLPKHLRVKSVNLMFKGICQNCEDK